MKHQVEKRDGRKVAFELKKIENAIQKAFDAQQVPYDESVLELLALRATAEYAPQVQNNTISVEQIQMRWKWS